MTWILVGVGGAVGSALGLALLRRPTPRRLLISTAVICALMGAVATQRWSSLAASLSFGVLGSAASMVALGAAPPVWLDRSAIVPTVWAVIKRLSVYCAVGVTFALSGYLAVRAGATLYLKLR